MQEVERYFQSGDFNPEYKVRRTKMPPIYFQHAGKSSIPDANYERLLIVATISYRALHDNCWLREA